MYQANFTNITEKSEFKTLNIGDVIKTENGIFEIEKISLRYDYINHRYYTNIKFTDSKEIPLMYLNNFIKDSIYVSGTLKYTV